MRALRTVIIAAVLFVVCTAAKTTFRKDENLLSKEVAVNNYVNAVKHGKAAKLSKVVDPTAEFTVQKGAKVEKFSKNEIIADLKAGKNIDSNCVTRSKIIENDADESVVKVDMKYKNSTRSNYITLANDGNGWKITNVYTLVK